MTYTPKISVSGAVHSSVEDMRRYAENNKAISLSDSDAIMWIGSRMRNSLNYKDTNVPQRSKQCFCIDSNTYLGAILFRIAPEYNVGSTEYNDTTYCWNKEFGENYHEVDTSGVLTFAINDIYFEDTSKLSKYATKFQERFGTIAFKDSVDKIISHIKNAKSDTLENYKRMFYDDNIGQILVCIEIQHPLHLSWVNPMYAFRWMDTKIEQTSEKSSSRFVFDIKSVGFFLIFSLWICGIFLLFIIMILVSVYLWFIIGYWLYLIVKAIKKTCVKGLRKNNNQHTMTLSKDEFKVLVMLYAASIDGKIYKNEVEVILEKNDAEVFKKVKKIFLKMSDIEVLECIGEYKRAYAADDDSRKQLLDDIKAVIEADENCSAIEDYLYMTMERILS